MLKVLFLRELSSSWLTSPSFGQRLENSSWESNLVVRVLSLKSKSVKKVATHFIRLSLKLWIQEDLQELFLDETQNRDLQLRSAWQLVLGKRIFTWILLKTQLYSSSILYSWEVLIEHLMKPLAVSLMYYENNCPAALTWPLFTLIIAVFYLLLLVVILVYEVFKKVLFNEKRRQRLRCKACRMWRRSTVTTRGRFYDNRITIQAPMTSQVREVKRHKRTQIMSLNPFAVNVFDNNQTRTSNRDNELVWLSKKVTQELFSTKNTNNNK